VAKNKTRGTPKKKTNQIRDSGIVTNIKKDVEQLLKSGISYISKNKRKLITYFIFAYIGNKLAFAYRYSRAKDIIGRIMDTINSINDIISNPFPSFHYKDLVAGIVVAILVRVVLYMKMQNAKNYRKGEEYGSASFGTEKDIEPYIDWDNPYNNLLLSDTERLSMEPRMKDPATNRNKNVIVIGGSGAGKTRGHVKPNIMQLFSSYIITDPKGTTSVR